MCSPFRAKKMPPFLKCARWYVTPFQAFQGQEKKVQFFCVAPIFWVKFDMLKTIALTIIKFGL